MARIDITSIVDPIDVDLWGDVYDVAPLTKNVASKADEIEEQVDDLLKKAKSGGEVVAALGKLLDIRLKAQNGGSKASTVIKRQWDAGELSLEQVTALARSLADPDLGRPT